MIITIDGPSGTGKTTIAKKVAEKLGITYFDTGAMYRAVTLGLIKENIPLSNTKKVKEFLKSFTFSIHSQNGEKHYFANDADVTEEIRSQKVNEIVSEVAAKPFVRKALWKLQRDFAKNRDAVFEGRDLGTVVFPKAKVKVFLDATPEVRALRRLKEMREKLPEDAKKFDQKKMVEELVRRDTYDSTRKVAPLKCPKDAYRIDTSELNIDQVVEKIIDYHNRKAKKEIPGWLHSKEMHFFYRFILFLAWCFFKIFYRLKIYGTEHYTHKAAIIAPNHTSYFDPPIAAVSWPDEVHFLAKEELFKGLFGSFIRALNAHPVSGDVGDISVFKTILQLLKEGRQIVLFPEGRRMDGEFGIIKPGIGMLLMRSQAAIIPTYIHGAYEIWNRGQKFPKLFGKKLVCVFGTPIIWESFAHLEKRESQEEIARRLSEALVELKSWYTSGAKGIPP